MTFLHQLHLTIYKQLGDPTIYNRSLKNPAEINLSQTLASEDLLMEPNRSMAQAHTLEGIKGGGGTIKVGTIGTISSLMTRELEQQIPSTPHKPITSRTKPRTLSSNSNTTPKKLHPRKSFDEGSSSSAIHRSTKIPQKTKSNGRHSHRAPMLGFDSFVVDRSPMREKNDKKISNIVEVVDVKCGNSDKAWATPLTNRLKKLGFSKLSETIN